MNNHPAELCYRSAMRKTAFVNALCTRATLFCFAALIAISIPSFAQVPTSTAMPSDPKELMLLAAKTNGLTGDDVKPWHLKATYKALDEQGNVKDQGTYEESWVSPQKFKRTFTGTAFTQTEYGSEKGILVSGAQDALPGRMVQLRNEFVGSMLSPESIQQTSFAMKQREIGNIKFDCLSPITAAGVYFGTTWCLDAGKTILRINAPPQGAQVVHNSIVKFQGRYIAEDLLFAQAAKTTLTAHIDNIELLNPVDETLFQPPPDATPMRMRVNIAAGVMVGMLAKKVAPEYPLFAKEEGISGTIVLQAIIGKDGRIANLHVVSGPPELQQAALDAVKKWVYRPYLLNNEPVEVLTTINVIFMLGNHSR
jgi:TonB family protein